ncbi:ABC transporter permease [Vreelandella arcis]|uniref:Spermidine/putrescine transport system permease protein n=1 Tax=Vreelandella arcis TaxID=416873 RepID=A0A1H0CHZ3_9GAMM|nr:ABC transporter permease [Halomonas arcis]SDN57514.1 spermidine/putrescine transport system permease protein [Halomonas arcis]
MMSRPTASWLLGLYALGYIAVLYLPILFIPIFSFNDSIYVSLPLKDFTWKWYEQLLQSPEILEALWNSLIVGVGVSAVSTVLGLFCAIGVTTYEIKGKSSISAIVAAPIAIPFIILGIFLLLFFEGLGVPLSLFTIGVSHVLLTLPFAFLTQSARLRGFDKNLLLASADLGENWWMTFFRVTLPIVWPAMISSFILCFTISLDEFMLAFFVSGSDITLPLYIWNQLRFPEQLPVILALGSAMLGFSIFAVVTSELIRRRGKA